MLLDARSPIVQERLSALPPEALARMADAAVEVVDCMRELHESGSNLVLEAMRGSAEFVTWEHYPADGVRDPRSHAQYFLHAHSPDDRARSDYAHFHTFMGVQGMPVGVRPAEPAGCSTSGQGAPMAHLIAISMTPTGMPECLFTTNRWVTGESWYRAQDVTDMLDRFVVAGEGPSPVLNRWLTAMLVLFRPQIETLLVERDRVVSDWHGRYPDTDVFEDRRLDITSSLDIALREHIEWLESRIDA